MIDQTQTLAASFDRQGSKIGNPVQDHDLTKKTGRGEMGATLDIDIPLRAGKPPLTLNQRLHWREKAKRTKTIRESVAWSVKALHLDLCEHITVQLNFSTGDKRRRDADNLVATQKPAFDGLVDAGLIPDDTPDHLTWIAPAIHTGPGIKRLWMTITVTDPTTGHASLSAHRKENR